MKTIAVVALAVLSFMVVGQLVGPVHSTAGGAASHVSPGTTPAVPVRTIAPAHVAAPATTGYARTVLIETFTAQWCVYCEQESQALYAIEHQGLAAPAVTAELHICYSSSNCGDSYPTPDGTGDARTSYYGVQAFPTVFFDGGHVLIGAASTLAALEAEYIGAIDNASMVPANVSIDQTATESSTGMITSHATIDSAVTGSYRAIQYLVEFIGKNDSTHHDIEWVLRGSLTNQAVSLTAGSSVDISGSLALGSGWNDQHLYVITFVQDYNTKVVQNSNMIGVTTIQAAVATDPSTVAGGYPSNITVTVTNTSTGAVVPGASVTVTSALGGTVWPIVGTTDSNGVFTTVFTSPHVTAVTTFPIRADVTAAGYTAGFGIGNVVVNPLDPPSSPLGLKVVPQDGSVLLTWGAPTSGGGGVTYNVYRSTEPATSFALLATVTDTTYADAAILGDQSYAYVVNAQNGAGFSSNASAVTAASLTWDASGLPTNVGFWVSIDAAQVDSPTGAPLNLHIPAGAYAYETGPDSYAWLASQSTGTVSVSTVTPTAVTAAFAPRYATLDGTISPASATVTIDGSAVAISGGDLFDMLQAGSYSLQVSNDGYQTYSDTVTLTPGNETTVTVALTLLPAGPGTGSTQTVSSSSSGGLTTAQAGLIVGVVGVVGAVAVVAAALSARKRGGRRPPRRRTPAE